VPGYKNRNGRVEGKLTKHSPRAHAGDERSYVVVYFPEKIGESTCWEGSWVLKPTDYDQVNKTKWASTSHPKRRVRQNLGLKSGGKGPGSLD